jgi:hypothetical protein
VAYLVLVAAVVVVVAALALDVEEEAAVILLGQPALHRPARPVLHRLGQQVSPQ